jgi:nucleotide-binding universal stress UspA family protein
MERIAVGLSDPASQKAIDWVIERARARPLEVTLVAAYDWFLTPRGDVTRLLRIARERIGAGSPRTVVHLAAIEADPIRALAGASEHADLLVVGAHLRRRLAALSEPPALKIARHASCATVIVPEAWVPTAHGVVAVGVDDDSSLSAVEFAAGEVEQSGARLELVRAWTAPMPAYDPLIWIVDTEGELRVWNRQRLGEQVSQVERDHPTARVGSLLAECLPGAALQTVAADLLVIGSHRRGPIASLIVGSTAHELLGSLSIPLCIVPMEQRMAGAARSGG